MAHAYDSHAPPRNPRGGGLCAVFREVVVMAEQAGGASEVRAQRAHADSIVERAASELRELLPRIARVIDPFPPFPGAMFTYGIEVDPRGELPGDYGCVVLGDDGGLYELVLTHDAAQEPAGDPVATRSEELRPLDEMPAADFVAYAHRAVLAAAAHV
jgi:hypothetical protein